MVGAAHGAVGVAIAVTTICVSSSERVPVHVNCGVAMSNCTGGLRTSSDFVRRARWQAIPRKRRQAMLQARAELNDSQKESLQLYGKIERSVSTLESLRISFVSVVECVL